MRINNKYSSYMSKFLFLLKINVYKACNPTILNLSIVKEKMSLELLDYRPKINHIRMIWGFVYCMCILLLLVRISWVLSVFYLIGCKMKNEISHMLTVVEEHKKNIVDVLSLLRHSCRRCVGRKSLLPMETPQFYGSAVRRDAEAPVRRHYVKDPQPKKTSA